MAEVIFAILILGLGLILLAAAFPIGIVQTGKTQDLTNASIVARMAYDQMTKVPASGVVPQTISPWTSATLAAFPDYPVTYYGADSPAAGKPLVMGLIDGTQSAPAGAATPDLRLKLVYPFSLYSDDIIGGTPPWNPTGAEDCPQGQVVLGRAAYGTTPATSYPIPFAFVWGFRSEVTASGLVWYENVQWAYPADRRYYWYAFYRQMYDAPFYHPSVLVPGLLSPQQTNLLNQVQADHITRRTYRVMIVVCKTAQGQKPVLPPEAFRALYVNNNVTTSIPMVEADFNNRVTPVDNKLAGANTGSYAEQWTRSGLAPVRIPTRSAQDNTPDMFDLVGPWIGDKGTFTYIANSIAQGFVRRGGIVLDCWGNVYQITDMTTNAIRLDRSLAIPPVGFGYTTATPDVRDCLPLWFNPNAIAVFPTVMTKQADMP